MSATLSSDIVFNPQIFADHVQSYFDRKLVYGAFAMRDDSLAQAPGLVVDFPYHKSIGDAEEPLEDAALNVDNLSDDSFQATVKEIGKAVGIKKKAFKKSAARQEGMMAEAARQIGVRMAEKVDKDLLTEFSASGNFEAGYTATGAGDVLNIRSLLQGKQIGLGDRADEAVVCFMHSRQVLDLLSDSTSGFLKADANDPAAMVNGFVGRLLGMAIIQVDTVPQAADIGGKNAFDAYVHAPQAYGLMVKQDMEIETDVDILNREWVITGNQWYAVKSFHAKINAENKRTLRLRTTVTV